MERCSPSQVKKRQDAFLAALKKHGYKKHAAKAAGISRETVRQWEKKYPAFAEELGNLKLDLVEDLEDGAAVDAIRGCVTTRIFLLKALKPDVYRDHVKVEGDITETKRVVLVFPGAGDKK